MQPTIAQHVEIRPNRGGGQRAYVAGTRVRVQDIVPDHERHGLSIEEIVRNYPQLTIAQVHAALAYYFDNRELVREHIRDADFLLIASERSDHLGIVYWTERNHFGQPIRDLDNLCFDTTPEHMAGVVRFL
ncbi:hypothetical protein Mal64_36340 [Pseudobythopirellula maris]|uniref:DUF433 domain-containing protein n=1 Tax=Pseudobythopirellula maris TaxID=2527991 RepID=A0A5C5ZHI3_9BACT|nr:DUF433 domain-containing protein [Pseudobythopirellula maris]TWT86804.1 hypothetical protein Mal64_36340 [Pseudobythopirellula maris]